MDIECSRNGVYPLDDYVGARDDTIPPRVCTAFWFEGTPAFDVRVTLGPLLFINQEAVTKTNDGGAFEYGVLLPLMPSGTHELSIDVVDSSGEFQAQASIPIHFGWNDNRNGSVEVKLTEPPSGPIEVAPGERFEIAVKAFALGFDDTEVGEAVGFRQGQRTEFLYDLLADDVVASWDFGDGSVRTTPIRPLSATGFDDEGDSIIRNREIDVSLTESHAYQAPGDYEVTVTVTDELYERRGSANLRVVVREPETLATPETEESRWVFAATQINPDMKPLAETLTNFFGATEITVTASQTNLGFERVHTDPEGVRDWSDSASFQITPPNDVDGDGAVLVSISGTWQAQNTPSASSAFIRLFWGLSSSGSRPDARLDLGELRQGTVDSDSFTQTITLPSSDRLESGRRFEIVAELFVPHLERVRVVWIYELK